MGQIIKTTDRELFLPAEGIYLLNHSVGRPPVSTRDAWNENFMLPWEVAGESVWPRWLESLEGFRAALGRLLNSAPENYCPQVNLSSALTKILHSLPVDSSRNTIVYTEQDFPSIAYVLQQAVKRGFQLQAIPAAMDTGQLEHWADALGDDAAFLLLTHVHSNTGKQVPVAEITKLARQRDVVSIVDVAQSVGCVPIDLADWSADFVIGSCVKWLCGGPGAGFLWVDPERVMQCEPVDVGWFSHENPFEFDINNFRYATGALRFWGGTPSVQPFTTAANSIETMVKIGVDKIRHHNLALTQKIIDALPAQNLVTPAQNDSRGGTLVIRFTDKQQARLCSRLRECSVLFDTRPTGIRLSPHIYNDIAEIDVVLECLQGVMRIA